MAGQAKEDDPAVLARLIDDLSDRIVLNARGHVEALKRLTALRRRNQELQDAFHGLEKSLPADANLLDLVFSDDPLPDDSGMVLAWNGGGMVQILPAPSDGVSAFQLRFRNIQGDENAILHVHLTAVEDQRVIDRWTVPLQRLEEGWTTFSLNRTIVGPSRTLELRLNIEAGDESRMTVCRGAPQPLRNFQLREGATGAARAHGIAVRVWCGTTRAAHAVGPNYIVADSRRVAASNSVEVPVAPALLAKASHANPDTARFDFPPVKSVPNQIAVECHPPAVGFTMAQIPLPTFARPLSISARTVIRNPKSRNVDFAIVLCADADRATALLGGTAKPLPHEGFSDWSCTSSDRTGMVNATIARPDRKRPKLFFATRMEAPGGNFFAWARFRDVMIEVQS